MCGQFKEKCVVLHLNFFIFENFPQRDIVNFSARKKLPPLRAELINKRSGNPRCIIRLFPNYYNCVLEGRILAHTYAVHAVKFVSVYVMCTYIIHDWLKCVAVRRRSQQRLVAASLLIAKVKITTLRLTTLYLPSSVTFLCNFLYPCLYTDIHTFTNMCTCTAPIQMIASV